jgi:hypothetical protein
MPIELIPLSSLTPAICSLADKKPHSVRSPAMIHAAGYQAFGSDFYIESASAQFANAVFHDEYQIRPLRPHTLKTIVDIGAHLGSFSVLCHEFWPDAKIVAIEPHPESFELLRRNRRTSRPAS